MKSVAWFLTSVSVIACCETAATAQTVPEVPAAQSNSDGNISAKDIVVTARKRSETVQSVPATVGLIDSQTIASKAVQSFSDISTVAPSINISNAPSPSMFSITIRGLGSEPGNPSFDSSVSLFVDGVYTPRAREFSSALFDVRDIETIKGTEAALLGKNTSLGAVNLTTRKPGTTMGFDFLYSHEFELGSNRVEAGIDLPVSPTLRFRVSGLYDNDLGWIRNTIDGTYGPNTRTSAGRIVGVWTPDSSIDVTAMYQLSHVISSGANAEFVRATAAPAALAAAAGYPGTFDADLNDRTAIYSSAIGGANFGDQNGQRGSLTVNWHLGDYVLTAQTGYTQSDTDSRANVSYLPDNYSLQYVDDNSKQFTQEVRLTSPEGRRIDYIVGVLYLNGKYDNDTTNVLNYPPASAGAVPLTGTALTNFYQKDQAISGFGQLDAKIVSKLKLSLGLRYTNEKKSVDLGRQALVPGLYTAYVLPPYAPFSLSHDEGSVDGSLGLSYQATPTILLYGSVGQGTKAGGYAQAASRLDESRYDPERARTAELGFKSQFADRRVTLNAAAFYTTVHDFQLVTFDGLNFDVNNTNLRSYGVEAEAAWAPTRSFRLFWNNTYAHAEDTVLHSETTHAPRWSGIGGFVFRPEVADGIRLAVNGDVTYRSSEVGQRAQASVIRIPRSTRVNAGIGLESEQNGWSVRVIGKNLNNERNFGFVFPAPSLPAGNVVAIPLQPRTIMLQFGLHY